MNVLFHGYEFPPQAGGVGTYMLNMASALRAAGHGTVVVTSRAPGLPEEEQSPAGVVYRLYDRVEMYAPRVADAVLALARNHAADLVEGADHYGETAALPRSRGRPPVLVKIHGSNPIRVVQAAQVIYPWQRLMLRLAHLRNRRQTLYERRSIEQADLVTSPSRRMLEEVRLQGLRLPPAAAVIPNPAMPGRAVDVSEAARPTLLLPARLEVRKGIQYLPRIVGALVAKHPDLVLEIAGDDSYARGLGSLRAWLTRQLGALVPHVSFLGVLRGPELDAAYGRAWAVLLPSRWDNFPTVVLEAMVQSKPVVTTPFGGMPDMLEGTLCKTAPPDSPEFVGLIDALLSNAAWRREAGASLAKKMAMAYSPSVVARQYVDFVRSHV